MSLQRRPHQPPMFEFMRRFWDGQKAGCVIASEMGVGKTWPALDIISHAKERGAERFLVVTPAIVRQEWVRQNSLYETGLQIDALDTGAKVAKWCDTQGSGVLVTSYHLLQHVTGPFQIVQADECQRVSNPDVKMSRELRRIVETSAETFFLPFSGTPSEDRPCQLWNILDMLEPGQWGSSIWAFRRRYMEAIPNQWAPGGVVYKGLRADRAEELKRRLDRIMYRVTKADIAGSLPPLIMSMRYIKPKRSKLDWDSEDGFSQLLELNSSAKLDATVDIIEQARNAGESKFVAFTFLRQTADELGARLRAIGISDVQVVTGALSADKRHGPIERVRNATGTAALVCTVDSCGVGIDMTFAQTAVFAELHFVPGKLSQAMGRLIRLSSTHACNCIFIVCEGTREQKQAEALCRKQSALDRIIAGGRDEKEAQRVLSGQQKSDEDVLAELLGAA